MKIQKVTDGAFRKYGKILEGYVISEILERMEHIAVPPEVCYVPSEEMLEQLKETEQFRKHCFGGMPVQTGYCIGNNRKLNALEYHRSSEINIAATDMILLLGLRQDIEDDHTYSTEKVEGFFVPRGTVVEIFAATLHYAPCAVNSGGFKSVVVLPEGTNLDLGFETGDMGEDRLLAARNKWLLAHKDAGIEGAFCGLKGKNINLDGL